MTQFVSDKASAIQVRPGTEGTRLVLDTVDSFLRNALCPEEVRRSCLVVTDELCTNIACYAGAESLCVSAEIRKTGAKLVFTDDGIEFDPTGYNTEDKDAEEEPIEGGLGIMFMLNLADRVNYRRTDGKNELTVEFDLPGETA